MSLLVTYCILISTSCEVRLISTEAHTVGEQTISTLFF